MPEQPRRLIARGDINQILRDQPVPAKRRLIMVEAVLVIDATLDVVEGYLRQIALGHVPQILEIYGVANVHDTPQ